MTKQRMRTSGIDHVHLNVYELEKAIALFTLRVASHSWIGHLPGAAVAWSRPQAESAGPLR